MFVDRTRTVCETDKDEPLVDDRKLTEEELLSRAQESSQLRIPTASGTLSRSSSSNVLTAAADTKRKKSEIAKPQQQRYNAFFFHKILCDHFLKRKSFQRLSFLIFFFLIMIMLVCLLLDISLFT